MIKILINENLENSCHQDLEVQFDFAKTESEIGDTYYWAVHGEYTSYDEIVKEVIKDYYLSYDILLKLKVNRSYIWYYYIWDQSALGIVFTKKDWKTSIVEFCIKIGDWYDRKPEYVFTGEKYELEHSLFLNCMKSELDKYLK